MSDRERTDEGTFAQEVTLDDVLGVFDEVRGPVVTSSDVADALDCSTEAARQKLKRLYEDGAVDRRKTGRITVWWFTGGERITPDEVTVEEDAERMRERDERRREESADQSDPTPSTTDSTAQEETLDAVEFPATKDREECLAAIEAAREYLRGYGPCTKRDLVAEVMPEHPVGYDAESALEQLDAGERYRGAWWRRIIKPGLKALDTVDAPARGQSEWRYTGDPVEDADVYDPTEEF